jgi:hypothetical protein
MGLYIGLYILMAILTFSFNLLIIGGMVEDALAVIRNALLWPIFLPILIYITIRNMG